MSVKLLIASSIEDLGAVAKEILSEMSDSRIFAFKGAMGAGKTTLIKSFCEVLEVSEVVSSPTFALVNEYSDKNSEPVYHFDFYRIKKIEEVYDIGYEEYFYSDFYCFIEWPELVSSLLPEKYVEVNIQVEEDEQRLISYGIKESGK